jgi:hypothetical protein
VAYVEKFKAFEQKIALLHAHSLKLSVAYPGVFPHQDYPRKPDLEKIENFYTLFKFSDWVVNLASQNNNLKDTVSDLDDPGMLAEKIHVSCRGGACGHGPANAYTSWNWCGGQHVRAIRTEIFDVALLLQKNQKSHDNYVRDTKRFDKEAQEIISNYWKSIKTWNGTPSDIQDTKIENTKTKPSKLTSTCKTTASDIKSIGYQLCDEVEAHNKNQATTQLHGEIIKEVVVGSQEEREQLISQILSVQTENENLRQELKNNDWSARERALRDEFAKTLLSRESEDENRDRMAIARFFGKATLCCIGGKK